MRGACMVWTSLGFPGASQGAIQCNTGWSGLPVGGRKGGCPGREAPGGGIGGLANDRCRLGLARAWYIDGSGRSRRLASAAAFNANLAGHPLSHLSFGGPCPVRPGRIANARGWPDLQTGRTQIAIECKRLLLASRLHRDRSTSLTAKPLRAPDSYTTDARGLSL